MSLVITNESVLPIYLADHDIIAIGMKEEEIPTLEECCLVKDRQEAFRSRIDWKKVSGDEDKADSDEREVTCSDPSKAIVVMQHTTPRYEACGTRELTSKWQGMPLLVRTTTLTYENGESEYVVEDVEAEIPRYKATPNLAYVEELSLIHI